MKMRLHYTINLKKRRTIPCDNLGIKLKSIVIAIDTPSTVRKKIIEMAVEKNIEVYEAVLSDYMFSLEYRLIDKS